MIERIAHELRAAADLELALGACPVRLDRPHAEIQLPGDLGIGVTQPDDPLGGAEAFTGAGSLLVEEVRYVKGTDPIVDLE